ncbi:glycoside hydrolase family 2 protein [Bacteroides sp.]|uniref:glycoside hydrolase family 2 protein n=1 Tax=Bacteroides sp. TaxID=29523 RepID=UPI003A946999
MNNKQMIRFTIYLLLLCSLPTKAQIIPKRQAPLMTPWSADVPVSCPLPEYPRPIMEREEWMNLNGIWGFEEAAEGDKLPTGKKLKENILVPYPWESALSGIQRQLDSQRAWYKRTFSLPDGWKDKEVLLNFGAVDWESDVYINGRHVGSHRGGYDPFNFNITPYLNWKGREEIIVKVWDPGNSKAIAHGKQNNTRFSEPKGYSYSPASGIWQTVWLEPVNKNHLTDLHIVPDLDKEMFKVKVNSKGSQTLTAEVQIWNDDALVACAQGLPKKEIGLNISNPKLWSPDSPYLYKVIIRLKDSTGHVFDEIKSYTGMRKISLKNENGVQRLALNNQFIFQMGPLDQGYWPDGIYTAPTDEALRWEVENIRKWGFNMVRKHIKVEPQRWYYWCDKLGLLVWQDMPNCFKERDEEEKNQFEQELTALIKTHHNHPSIINWIVFNEHWGIYDCERLTRNVMHMDPSRLVTGNSGIDARKPSIDYEVGHIKDNHSYRPPHVPLISSRRATVNGEYGAIGYKIEGHIWDTDGPWVHHQYAGKEAATAEYEKFIGQINTYIARGLSAAVYTQWTDVENEMNGLYTYDRKVEKLDRQRVYDANRSTYAPKEINKGQTDAQHIQ